MGNYFKISVFIFVLSILLSGCGGGGGTSAVTTDTTSSSTTVKSIEVSTTSTSSSNIESSTSQRTRIVDANNIEGLKIQCGTEVVFTLEDGSFECNTFPFSIYLGEYKLSSIEKINYDNIILTQDILHQPRGAVVYPEVIKLSMIFQSLDSDATLSNGIQLDKNVLQIVDGYLDTTSLEEISFDDLEVMLHDIIDDVSTSYPTLHLQFVSKDTAQTNLATTTANLPVSSFAKLSIGRL
jgi:hypothetical protein